MARSGTGGGAALGLDAVASVLADRGLIPIKNHHMAEGLAGENLKADFYIESSSKFPDGLAIMVRSQVTSGSTDSKLYSLAANIPATFRKPTVVVLVGGLFKQGIVDYLKSRIGKTLIGVFTLDEFKTWAKANL